VQTGRGAGPGRAGHEDDTGVVLAGAASGPDSLLFADDLEAGPSLWTTLALPADSGTSPWQLTAADTINWFCSDEAAVKDQAVRLLAAQPLPPLSRLRFRHRLATQNAFDGGVLEYSLDGGATWFDILQGGDGLPANPARFLTNGYNGTLAAGSNPLAGRQAWSGNSGGYRQVTVDLADFAGRNALFRWRLGCDAQTAGEGWWLADLALIAGSPCIGLCTSLAAFVPLWPEHNILDLLACPLPDR